MKAIHQRNPTSPRNTSALVSPLCSVLGEAAQGNGRFGANLVMDFKVQQLEPLVNYSPCSLGVCEVYSHGYHSIISFNSPMPPLKWQPKLI